MPAPTGSDRNVAPTSRCQIGNIMEKSKVKFGTDGWRGVIAEDFTFENVRRVAQATADYWNSRPLPKTAIIGYDNRFFSEVFAKLVCEVFAANGIRPLYPPVAVP